MAAMAPIIDTHCHLDYLEDREGVTPAEAMLRAKAVGVELIIIPSVSPKNFAKVMAIAETMPNVYAAVAIHPTDVLETSEFPDWRNQIESMLSHPKVVGLGETGLDYFWSTDHVDLQKTCLTAFLELGKKHNLPVILHDRDVPADKTFPASTHVDIHDLVASVPGCRGVMHCFSGDAAFARKMIDKNFYISFAGNLTYKNAHNLHEAARETPLEYIVVETDTPFLAPVPHRGKPNEPAYVKLVVEKIAELKGVSYDEVATQTTANAKKLFGLPKTSKETK